MRVKYLEDYAGAKKDQMGHVSGSHGRWLVKKQIAVEVDDQGKEVIDEPAEPKKEKVSVNETSFTSTATPGRLRNNKKLFNKK